MGNKVWRSAVSRLLLLAVLAALTPGSDLRAGTAREYANPARTYCEAMGYTYSVKKDQAGNEYGVCRFPDRTSCDAWDFYKGKAGQKFSYCSSQGLGTASRVTETDSYTLECAVCFSQVGPPDEIPMIDLMRQNNDLPPARERLPGPGVRLPSPKSVFRTPKAGFPQAFDLRNLDGKSYIGPVRDQGSCGSCYSFGAAAAAEGAYNLATGSSDDACIDLSEAFIMWCLGKMPGYSGHFSGCDGADYEYMEVQALVETGIVRESDYPYTIIDPGTCDHMDDPRIQFSDWGRIGCNDTDGIKAALQTYGVLDAAVLVTSDFQSYSGGIFCDSNTACGDC